MEISRRRSMSLDSDGSSMPAPSSYPPTYANCRNNMYAMQATKFTNEPKISRLYSMKTSLSVDSATSDIIAPKRENFLSTVVGAFTSIVVARFAKVPSTFMSNISNINNSLSVTIVPNEGIISQEFFKNLTTSREQLASEKHLRSKQFTRTTQRLPSEPGHEAKSQISQIFADNARTDAMRGGVSSNLKNNEPTSERYPDKSELNMKISTCEDTNEKIHWDCSTRIGSLSAETVAVDDFECIPRPTTEMKTEMKEFCSPESAVQRSAEFLSQGATREEKVTSRWGTMWQRVVDGMTERFDPRAVSPDSVVPPKKANIARPRRKTCPTARGRGKGRGKSQLRRSGVSQSRHRKEHTKHNINSNIQDDLEAWEDFGRYDESGDDDAFPESSRIDDDRSPCRDANCSKHCSTLFENFNFEDLSMSRKRKQSTGNRIKCPVRVRYVPDSSSMEVEGCGNGFEDEIDRAARISDLRPRLVSESSVDSEDSYCIVFESGSDSEYTDYDFGVTDDDLDDNEKTRRRVRFNLEPQIHKMIQWDFAYRAARPGPWEQMGRDRVRFRDRIHELEKILDPILSARHRKCVWQERFDVDD